MLFGAAVLAATTEGLACLGAVASTMTLTLAVCTSDDHGASRSCALLLLWLFAVLALVTELLASPTLRNVAVHGDAGLNQTLHILLWSRWPAFGELGTLWLGRELEGHDVLEILDALEVDDGVACGDLLLLGDEVDVHSAVTEGFLELLECEIWEGLGVSVDALQMCQ